METFWKDLRYAFRMLFKSPGFTIVAVLALGLGIGANTAIFSVFNGMLWRPLPVKDAQQLVVVTSKSRDLDFPLNLSYPDFQDYRQLKTVFSDLLAYTPNPVNFGAEGRPERAWAEMVSGNYFSMLGLEAIRGRTFAPDEGWIPGKDPLMVLSYKYWQKRFGGNPSIIGQTVLVNQHPFTVIGVAPENYRGAYYWSSRTSISLSQRWAFSTRRRQTTSTSVGPLTFAFWAGSSRVLPPHRPWPPPNRSTVA